MVEEPNKNYARLITELRESLAWMDLVLSNINEGILAVGDDLKVLFANDAIADMLDKLRITLLGIPIWDVLTLSVEDEPVLKDNFQEAFRRGNLESITGRYKLHRESKKELTVDISISPIAKTNQTILIIRDITQQLKNERALIKEQVARTQEKVKRQKTEENRRLLQSIIDGSATIIYLKDPEGRYTMINSQYKKIFGLDGSDIIGKTDFDLFSREVAEALIKNDQHVLRVKKTIKWEESITYKNDRRTYIFSKFPLLDSAGDPHSLCGILTDITARKELEDRKDTFINMASHELKTPLTSMKLYWEFTKKHITKGKAEESLYSLEKINSQLDKLTKLSNNLLNISRIETDSLGLDKEKFELGPVVEDAIETVQATTNKHSIYLESTLDTIKMWGDKHSINQVLLNLLSNAVKYSPNGGDIIVEIKKEQDFVMFAVKDLGIGIAKEDQKKIFNRFYKVIDGPQSEFPGLGIGLYIASEIVEQHGGTMSVKSRPGEGSTFVVRIPLA